MQVNGAKEDTKVLFMSDTKTFFSKNYGWSAGMGDRNGRWVMVIERDGTVSVADVEENGRQVTVSLHHLDTTSSPPSSSSPRRGLKKSFIDTRPPMIRSRAPMLS